MTDESKKFNIAQEVSKARQRLAHARLLHEARGYDTAVSQAYYAAFHFARALLLVEGLEARTHSGLIHLINVHFVRTGLVPPQDVRLLGNLESQRTVADYDAASVFTEDMADEAIASAESFGLRVVELLTMRKYLE